jgi:Zn-dependent protease with chaperone function
MRAILSILAAILFAGMAHARDLENVRSRICEAARVVSCPAVRFVGHFPTLAMTDGRAIYLSETIMLVVRDDADLAFLIGHEIGHIVLGHGPATVHTARQRELAADIVGASLATAAGHRCEAGADLLERISLTANQPAFLRARAQRVREFCRL